VAARELTKQQRSGLPDRVTAYRQALRPGLATAVTARTPEEPEPELTPAPVPGEAAPAPAPALPEEGAASPPAAPGAPAGAPPTPGQLPPARGVGLPEAVTQAVPSPSSPAPSGALAQAQYTEAVKAAGIPAPPQPGQQEDPSRPLGEGRLAEEAQARINALKARRAAKQAGGQYV
jgi:hypothetical protein